MYTCLHRQGGEKGRRGKVSRWKGEGDGGMGGERRRVEGRSGGG